MTSRVRRAAAKVVLVVTALTLGACSQYGVANRSISVNKGLESANNRMLLLNAVRASKRYPMVFSEVTQINTSDPVSGSLGLQVPFGGDAASNFILTPSIDLDSGTTMQITPLNKQNFTRGITTPTNLETLNYYLRQGWPPEMLFHMFVRTMRIKNACAETLLNRDLKARKKPIECKPGDKTDTTVWRNDPGHKPKDQERFKDFQQKLRDLIQNHELQVRDLQTPRDQEWTKTTRITKRVPEMPGEENKLEMVKQVTTEQFSEATKSSRLILGAKLPKVQPENAKLPEVQRQNKKEFDCLDDKDDQGPCYIEIEVDPLRSPEAMIFYMGELIETQLKSENHYVPTLGSKERPFLKVVNGRPRGGAAVKVSHEGETYAIPRADAGRSMHVLSLVSLILGLHREAKELPTTPTVTLTGQ